MILEKRLHYRVFTTFYYYILFVFVVKYDPNMMRTDGWVSRQVAQTLLKHLYRNNISYSSRTTS